MHVSLLILVLVQLLFCPNCQLHALLLLEIIGLDTMILFTKGTELTIFWSIKNSNDVLNKFKSKNFQAFKLTIYDFFYTVYYVTSSSYKR